jgi:hypothetical protein
MFESGRFGKSARISTWPSTRVELDVNCGAFDPATQEKLKKRLRLLTLV